MRLPHKILVVAAALASTAAAQFLTLPAGPVAPGSTISATYTNNTLFYASHPLGLYPASLVHAEGELIVPRAQFNAGTLWLSVPPGTTEPFLFQVPASGLGSSGSFALLYGWNPAAIGRLDVGAASPGFASIVALPPNVHLGYATHEVAFGSPAPSWAVGNTSAVPFTFAVGDQVQVLTPDGALAVVLATQSLAGISVPPGAVVPIPLPVAGLQPGPYTIAVSWNDPAAGAVVRRFGIHEAALADLYLPGGKTLPFGGSVTTYSNCDWLVGSTTSGPISFVQLADVSSGQSFLLNGQLIPIVADPISLACLTNALFGLILNGQGPATVIPSVCYGYCGPGGVGPIPARYQTPTTTILHPNVPGLSGTVVRLATLFFDLIGQRFVATQGEQIVLL